MRHIDEVVIHCAATRPGWMLNDFDKAVAEIRRWHVEGRGWSDIGYHFLISRHGAVAEGRPLARIGAHVRGHNRHSIGVCLLGGHGASADDAFAQHFTAAQYVALTEKLTELASSLGRALKISGHNQYAAKACPGFSVPAVFGETWKGSWT